MRVLGVVLVALLAAGCAQQGHKRVINFEAQGNMKASQPVGCVDIAELTSKHTPADIFPGVRECIDAGEYSKAVDLFAVAGLYGRYDMLRVDDTTAHQAMAVLQLNNLGDVDKAHFEDFKEVARKHLSAGSKDLTRICREVKRLGPPGYHPTYMIQYGMASFSSAGDGIKENFNSNEAWAASLDRYLHCPK